MVTLTPRERRSAGERIANDLRHKILQAENGLLPGVLLPPENRMAEQYSVSRPTLRQALAILRQEGLIATVSGQGSVICQRPAPDPDVTETVPADAEMAQCLALSPGTAVTRRRQIFYADDRPVRLVLTFTREQVA
jgi:DNA-binding GntR family transcriptional regulator